jgi:hypothetical protein
MARIIVSHPDDKADKKEKVRLAKNVTKRYKIAKITIIIETLIIVGIGVYYGLQRF